MAMRCPGRDANAELDSELVTCSGCGRTLEIFADEPRVRCRCGRLVFRDTLPSCGQWCPAAERCFGTVGLPAAAAASGTDQKEQEARLEELQKRIAEAMRDCAEPQLKRKGGEDTDDSSRETNELPDRV